MAVVDLKNINGEKISQIELSDDIFNIPVKASVLHEVVKMQLACRRLGTASVKRRSDVKGSGRKLFRQKGTGRARRGDIKAPLLKGGGVTFGPTPRSYAYKVPKKVKRLSLKMALSDKLQNDCLVVIDNFNLEAIKTKKVVEILNILNVKNTLIIIDKQDSNLQLSARNIPSVKVLINKGLNVYDILKYKTLILLKSSLKGIEERFSI